MILPNGRIFRAQTAVDFLATYGIALIIITISMGVAYQIGLANGYAFSASCTPAPGFTCEYYALNSNGILEITMAQATGGDIQINGMSCSSAINGTGGGGRPKYGNVWVSNSFKYYPYQVPSGLVNTDTKKTFYVYCYNGGGIAKPVSSTDSYSGFLWLNYTIPATGTNVIQTVASLQLKYT